MKIRIVSITEYGKIDKVIKIEDEKMQAELNKLFECSVSGNTLYLNEIEIAFDNGNCFKLILAPQKGSQKKIIVSKMSVFDVIRKFFRRKSS